MIKYRIPGSILLIASMSGIIANRHFTSSVYNSSKAAVIQLARSLAMEWGQIIPASDPDSPYTSFPTSGPDGSGGSVGGRLPIRVNALCPGNILTPMVAKNFEDDPGLEKLWKDLNMLGRLSRPREYRGVALFALSDASSFVSLSLERRSE
jgi:NAD(P)-dependent dehydrogenase (short-subunit alcohol dehydrogenase family)